MNTEMSFKRKKMNTIFYSPCHKAFHWSAQFYSLLY